MTKHITQLIIFATLVVFYAFFAFVPVDVFNSPDETANYVFIEQYAENNRLWYEYEYQYGPVQQFIFPRSTYSNGEMILPVGFWGLSWLYGTIAKVTGVAFVEYITPILAALAVFAFYGIAKVVFKREDRASISATAIFAMHPAWWYYSSRALFPNVPMMSFVIFGAYFLIAQPLKARFTSKKSSFITTYMDDVIGATMLCFALLIRPSELWWMALGALTIIFFKRKTFDWYKILAWIIPASVFAVIYYSVNASIYGASAGVAYLDSQSHAVGKWYHIFLPFGIDVKLMTSVLWNYMFKQHWWISSFALFGAIGIIIEMLKKKATQEKKMLLAIALVVTVYLLTLYGSFEDLGRHLYTIGISYHRYFLPVFALGALFIGYVYNGITRSFQGKKFEKWYASSAVFIFFMMSYDAVWLQPDGFVQIRDNLMHMQDVRSELTEEIPKLSIIATQYEDKFFFPQFQVMQNVENPDILSSIYALSSNGYPVYFFAQETIPEIESQRNQLHQDNGFRLEEVYSNEPHILYKVIPIQEGL